MTARQAAGQAIRLQWGALELVIQALWIALGVSARQSWGWLRVHGFRAKVRARRSVSRYCKKRRVARIRRMILALSLVTLLAVLASGPGAQVTLTAVTGLAGIVAARLAPGKLTAGKPSGRN